MYDNVRYRGTSKNFGGNRSPEFSEFSEDRKAAHKGIVKIDVVYVMSKINARPLRPGQQWPIFVVTYPHRPPSSGLSPREAIILNSGPAASHGMSRHPLPLLSKKRKKGHDTPKRWRWQKKCRSIYIIINRKEIYLIPRARR